MAIEVTSRWSGESLTRAVDRGWVATLEWDVFGTTKKLEALAAVGVTEGRSTHPESARLKCQSLTASRPGFSLWLVRAEYSEDQGGGGDDPLKELPKLQWEDGNETAAVDIDAVGTPILNGGQFPFDQQPVATVQSKFLSLRRNEPLWLASQRLPYENTYNDRNVTIRGVGTLRPGQLLCHTIGPAQEYSVGETPINVRYRFEVRAGRMDSDKVFDPFRHRILNVSYTGWWNDGGTLRPGHFTSLDPDNNHVQVSEPVHIDPGGAPLDPSITIKGQLPVAKVPRLPVVFEKTKFAYFLKFEKYRPANHLELGL